MVGDEWVRPAHQAAERFPTPFYLYDFSKIEQQIAALSSATHGVFAIRYAVKTNPNPALLSWLRGRVQSLDVSSIGEIRHTLRTGWLASELEFTGPAKTEAELVEALELGIGSLVLEDEDEVRIVARWAAQHGRRVPILLRISPQAPENRFAVRLAGRPTQFGIDEEVLERVMDLVLSSPSLELVGFHVYSGSQCLDGVTLATHFRDIWDLFCRAGRSMSAGVKELVFGGGLGIPYHEGEEPLSLGPLADVTAEIARDLPQKFPNARAYVETGRFLVGEAGLFVTRIVRVKESRAVRIGVCDGGMNHDLGACGHLGGAAHRHYALRNLSATAERSRETVRLVGPLCTAIDTLALRVDLPELKAGDLVGVPCGGAYGPTASPLYFIGHAFPSEVRLVEREGENSSFEDVSWLSTTAGGSTMHMR